MSRNNIPKGHKVKESMVKCPVFNYNPSTISFSFEALERTKYFNIDGTCANWASDLFNMLREVSSITKKDLLSGNYATYRVHSHETANPPSELPNGVELKDCYQIRISKSKGGIHGVFFDDIFYVIWLDPLHNMYPDNKYGGLREVKPPSTCCKDRDEIIATLKEEIQKLKEEIKYWENELNNLT